MYISQTSHFSHLYGGYTICFLWYEILKMENYWTFDFGVRRFEQIWININIETLNSSIPNSTHCLIIELWRLNFLPKCTSFDCKYLDHQSLYLFTSRGFVSIKSLKLFFESNAFNNFEIFYHPPAFSIGNFRYWTQKKNNDTNTKIHNH